MTTTTATNRQRSPEELSQGRTPLPRFECQGYEFHSIAISWKTSTELEFKGGIQATVTLDLAEFVLPPASFTNEKATRLLERKDLVQSILRTLDSYALNNRSTKSTPQALKALARNLSKLLEYGWLHGHYRISDWSTVHLRELAEQYAGGGWAHALNLQERFSQHLALAPSGYISYVEICKSVGTNSLRGDFVDVLKFESVANASRRDRATVNWSVTCSKERRHLSEKAILGVLEACTEFAKANGLGRPWEKTSRTARALATKDAAQTRSLTPDEVAGLMQRCIQHIENFSDPLIAAFQHLLNWRLQFPRQSNISLEQWDSALRASPAAKKLSELTGAQVGLSNTATSPSVNLYAVLTVFHTACFLPLAFMNGRRKDEILHSEIGLRADSLSVFDAELNLAVVTFFVEKTYQARVPFFVNSLTQKIILQLSKLSDIARQFESAHEFATPLEEYKRDSIFIIPDFRIFHGSANRIRIYQYLNGETEAWRLTKNWLMHQLGNLGAHTMRRAYALLHHYRYENTVLAALAQQLGHFFTESTTAYVTFTPNASHLVGAVWGPISVIQRQFQAEDFAQREQAVFDVGREKLEALVEAVMAADVYVAGGFAKLLRRYIQSISTAVSYANLNGTAKVKLVAAALSDKGHRPEPFIHGNCWRGASTSRHRGKCQSDEDQFADHSKATASVCNSCAYHSAVAQHTVNIRQDCANNEQRLLSMRKGTVEYLQLERQVFYSKEVIMLREERARCHLEQRSA